LWHDEGNILLINGIDIREILINTVKQIANDGYMGYDPYDILYSPFISKYISTGKKQILLTQLNRFSVFNFRSILGIKKNYNSKAMALILHAFIDLSREEDREDRDFILNWLIQNKSDNYDQYSIGFTFDVVLDHSIARKGESSLIISLFTIFAFMKYYERTKENRILELIHSFYDLAKEKLPHVEDEKQLWYSYNFHKENEIYNATAKIGKFFVLYYNLTKEKNLIEKIKKILNYLFLKQRPDGSWAYGENMPYTDGFHTAFILEAISYMLNLVDDSRYQTMFDAGLSNYKKYMFGENGQPLFFHPLYAPKDIRKAIVETDIRDCAMAIILFSKIGDHERAEKVRDWTLNNMYNSKEHYFYFYKNKFWTSKINYIRWQAWMVYALSHIKGVVQ